MIKGIENLIYKAKNDKNILAASIFGSFARGEKHRDIDVCLFLKKKKYSSLEMSKIRMKYLEESGSRLDIQIFQQLPVYIRQRILKEGKILLCKDHDELYDIAIRTVKEFEDFRPIYKSYLQGVKHG